MSMLENDKMVVLKLVGQSNNDNKLEGSSLGADGTG
jgi:hypothetical protein